MANAFAIPTIRFVQRLSIFLTLASCVYIGVFYFSKNQDNSSLDKGNVVLENNIPMPLSAPVLSLKSNVPSANVKVRDIFSLVVTTPSGAVDNTPKGQLPDHFKVVGIVIAHPSQIIIEDASMGTTYFIDEGHQQGGIKLVKAARDQMIINYLGQDIIIPITKK